MEIIDIIRIVDEDIANSQLVDNDENINTITENATCGNDSTEESMINESRAVVKLYDFLKCPNNLSKVYECDDFLTAGAAILMAAQVPNARVDKFNDMCVGVSFSLLFKHFEYGNELEKGFAATDILRMLPFFKEEMINIMLSSADLLVDHPYVDEFIDDDIIGNIYIFIDYIVFAMAPALKNLYDMYPQARNEQMSDYAERVYNEMEQSGRSIHKALRKCHLFSELIEIRAKSN